MSTQTKLPEKYRRARNIDEGYEVRLQDGTWLTVESVLHISAPFAVSSFTMTNGEQFSAHPRDDVMSRRPAAVQS